MRHIVFFICILQFTEKTEAKRVSDRPPQSGTQTAGSGSTLLTPCTSDFHWREQQTGSQEPHSLWVTCMVPRHHPQHRAQLERCKQPSSGGSTILGQKLKVEKPTLSCLPSSHEERVRDAWGIARPFLLRHRHQMRNFYTFPSPWYLSWEWLTPVGRQHCYEGPGETTTEYKSIRPHEEAWASTQNIGQQSFWILRTKTLSCWNMMFFVFCFLKI